MTPVHLPAGKHVREAGVDPAASHYRSRLKTALSFSRMGPCQTRTGFPDYRFRRIAIYAYRVCDFGANGAIERSSVALPPDLCAPAACGMKRKVGYPLGTHKYWVRQKFAKLLLRKTDPKEVTQWLQTEKG